MKNYLILTMFLFLLALSFNNCTTNNNAELSEISTDFIVVKYKTSTYIYDQRDTVCYFIQYENAEGINFITPENVFYDKKNSTISVINEGNTQAIYKHDKNIYGIGKIDAKLSNLLFKNMISTRSVENYYDYSNYYEPGDIAAVKCGCIKNTAKKQPTNCKSGGAGSTQCGVTDGGGVATVQWGNQCEVSCGANYYSCCAVENEFKY